MSLRRSVSFLLTILGTAACEGAPAPDVTPAECPVLMADGVLPASPDEATGRKQKGATFTNKEVRARYVCWVGQIGALNQRWKAEGLSAEERAKRAYQTRHLARLTARAMMTSGDDVKKLEERDQAKYGNPDGPTFEWLVEKAKSKGLSGDPLFEDIVSSAQRTDEATNKAFGL